MLAIKSLLQDWSSMLSLPNPKILPSSILRPSHYERKGRSHQLHVRFSLDSTALAFHELGHFFLEIHFGKIVPKAAFKVLFGNRDEDYDSPLLNVPGVRYLPSEHMGYLNLYAETHPEEDWAECFALVMLSIHNGEDLPEFEDRELQRKLKFVARAIDKALKEGAA